MRTVKRLVACAAIAAGAVAFGGVGGCSATGSTTPKVSGGTLTLYVSAPSHEVANGYADVVDAEELAFSHASHTVGRFSVRLRVLHASASDNARTAIQDSSAIAYLGELVPGESAGTVGITNAEDLLQVSPTDTALELTQSTPAVSGAPNDYYESLKTYGRNFGRVVPTSAAEARAQVAQMRSLGVHKVYVADDGSPYGRAIANAVKQDVERPDDGRGGAPSASRVSAAGADAVFFGATSYERRHDVLQLCGEQRTAHQAAGALGPVHAELRAGALVGGPRRAVRLDARDSWPKTCPLPRRASS